MEGAEPFCIASFSYGVLLELRASGTGEKVWCDWRERW